MDKHQALRINNVYLQNTASGKRNAAVGNPKRMITKQRSKKS